VVQEKWKPTGTNGTLKKRMEIMPNSVYIITDSEAARVAGVSSKTIRRLVAKGVLNCYRRPGYAWNVYKLAELETWRETLAPKPALKSLLQTTQTVSLENYRFPYKEK
jgi:excisionase family DNA binding protein